MLILFSSVDRKKILSRIKKEQKIGDSKNIALKANSIMTQIL